MTYYCITTEYGDIIDGTVSEYVEATIRAGVKMFDLPEEDLFKHGLCLAEIELKYIRGFRAKAGEHSPTEGEG